MIRILAAGEASSVIDRPGCRMAEAVEIVKPILEAVRTRGDEAVRRYAKAFDGFDGKSFVVEREVICEARQQLSADLEAALSTAKSNIQAFAKLQMPLEFSSELAPGHRVGQIIRPLETVAAYIPGGRYPLPSTVLMTCVPAKVAEVPNVWVTTPKPNVTIFAAAEMAGADHVALIGGAQAIAAFAFGTETIPKADRIVGPGNIYVAAAKKLLAGEVGIDFVAGPTEVLIIANEGDPTWIASDMLAQAEHDADASAILITTSRALADAVADQIEVQLRDLASAVAREAIDSNGAIILVDSPHQAADVANRIAPEHLCLHDPSLVPHIRNAGSIFLGPTSTEAAGDYITGPNHVLPTNKAARLTGGLSVLDFVKIITTQEISKEALERVGRQGATIARAEGLEAHARSIEWRLEPE